MPVMDGLLATRQIRALEQAGCDGHLSKPISKRNFLDGVAHWLQS